MIESFRPIPFRTAIGARRVIVEVPKPDAPVVQVERLHTHVRRLGKKGYRTQHSHLLNPDDSGHIHPPEEEMLA